MKALRKSKSLALMLSVGMVFFPIRTLADDIDIFVGASGGSATNPNVLVILDNTANWSAANQHWPGMFQGEAELTALKTVVGTLDDTINVGLMMMLDQAGGPRGGGFIRSAVRPMDTTNKAALQAKLQQTFDNFQTPIEKVPASVSMSAPLFDAWKYFGGYAGIDGVAGTPADATHFGPDVFNTKQVQYDATTGRGDTTAYSSSAMTRYVSPIGSGTGCGKNYVIYIGNGFLPKESEMTGYLSGVGGTTTEIALPNFVTTNNTATTDQGYSNTCSKSNSPSTSPYSCSVGALQVDTSRSIATGCSNPEKKWMVQCAVNTTTVTPTNTYSFASGNATDHKADEWTRFMYQGDASSESAQQNITTYTIDVFNDQQDANQTALLMSMARVGGGKYFAAKNLDQIVTALKTIFAEIQAVNSTFASASLPISATNRQLNDNEVYIGMFRPDSQARPRWFGNLKRYQLIKTPGGIELGDATGATATDNNTGFVTGCAVSYWTTDSGTYWADDPITPPPINSCTTSTTNKFSDAPDGPHVEKGSVAEVIRKGNNPPTTNTTPTWAVNRTMKTLSGGTLADFTTTTSGLSTSLVNYIRGVDVDDELANANITETRPSLHGDVVHSRTLAVAQGGTKGTTLYYGANDGTFRAVKATTGQERWAFIAPESVSRLDRLRQNSPIIAYSGLPTGITPTPTPKDYFFDGSTGLYQNADASQVWIYTSQRRGGRMIYGFDVSDPDAPTYKWRAGCTTVAPDDSGCTTNGSTSMSGMGQTWATPLVAFIKGYSSGASPVVIVGGGYDACEDANSSSPTCTSPKGRAVYILDGDTGSVLASFATDRSVAADVALVDIDYDGLQDYAYVADTGGNIYRIDFLDGPVSRTPLDNTGWAIHKVASTTGSGRKFLHAPSLLPIGGKVFVALGSGDREKPLETQYPYANPVTNRFYVYLDDLAMSATTTNLDDTTTQDDFTLATSCSTDGIVPNSTKKGWFMDLTRRGEQTVTSAVIAGGAVAFSTNRALPSTAGSCVTALGEARGYLVNLTNASGTIGSNGLCGGSRSSVFVGGGLPPSPVIATVRISDGNGGFTTETVGIGIVDPSGLGPEIPIRPRPIAVPLNLKRRPVYWFSSGAP